MARSTLLGAELKRLRGSRLHSDIVALSRRPALAQRIKPIDELTLHKLESGELQPGVAELHSLSVVYRVSMQELLDLMVQERFVSRTDLPRHLDTISDRFITEMRAGQWFEALALAIQGERLAESPSDQVNWRANRATCLERIGLRNTAIQMLLECAHGREALPQDRYKHFRALADALAYAGHVELARDAAQRAISLAPDDIDPAWESSLIQTQVRLTLMEAEQAETVNREAVRESLRLLGESRGLVPTENAEKLLVIDILAAVGRKLLGDHEAAARELRQFAVEARRGGYRYLEMVALIDLGMLHRQDGRGDEALDALETAEQIAVEDGFIDEAFDLYFEMYLVSDHRRDGKEDFYLKQCEEYYPLVQARSPNVMRYEALLRRAQ